jgi:methionine synthase II (cobalamin-independent)
MVCRGCHHSISVIEGSGIGGSRNRTSAVRRRWAAARSGTTATRSVPCSGNGASRKLSGSFAALADVPDDKVVVLGLVSSKSGQMEPADQLAGRIREASNFFSLDQLALSTQCGFASAGPGNAISEDAQENKLRLVAEVADRVWHA